MRFSSRVIASLTKKNRRRHIWYRIVSVLASVVVFCTTYAMILPAITLTEDHYCGLAEHEHTASCYRDGSIKISICTEEPHSHHPECYDSTGKLVCGMADYFLHVHSDICFDSDGVLACELPEKTQNVHSSECYLGNLVYSCGEIQGSTHIHEDACYAQA